MGGGAAHEEALEVSAMNFNACNGSSNTSCQDMHMNGSQDREGAQRGAWHFQALLHCACLIVCKDKNRQPATIFQAAATPPRAPTRAPPGASSTLSQLQLHLRRLQRGKLAKLLSVNNCQQRVWPNRNTTAKMLQQVLAILRLLLLLLLLLLLPASVSLPWSPAQHLWIFICFAASTQPQPLPPAPATPTSCLLQLQLVALRINVILRLVRAERGVPTLLAICHHQVWFLYLQLSRTHTDTHTGTPTQRQVECII